MNRNIKKRLKKILHDYNLEGIQLCLSKSTANIAPQDKLDLEFKVKNKKCLKNREADPIEYPIARIFYKKILEYKKEAWSSSFGICVDLKSDLLKNLFDDPLNGIFLIKSLYSLRTGIIYEYKEHFKDDVQYSKKTALIGTIYSKGACADILVFKLTKDLDIGLIKNYDPNRLYKNLVDDLQELYEHVPEEILESPGTEAEIFIRTMTAKSPNNYNKKRHSNTQIYLL